MLDRKMWVGFLFGMMMAVGGYAETPAFKVLEKASFVLNPDEKVTYEAVKFEQNGELFLQILGNDQKVLWKSESLGSEEKQFQLDGKPSKLAVADLDGDKIPEILTSAFYGPNASGLYVYKMNDKTKEVKPIVCFDSNEEPSRDFLVSDIRQEDGGDFQITGKGDVKILGMKYIIDKEPQPANYFFKLSAKGFELEKVELIPPQK